MVEIKVFQDVAEDGPALFGLMWIDPGEVVYVEQSSLDRARTKVTIALRNGLEIGGWMEPDAIDALRQALHRG
jgi:hypothetical protein